MLNFTLISLDRITSVFVLQEGAIAELATVNMVK